MKLKLNVFPIDYVWYIGERSHQQYRSPGDGSMLIAMCWYCTFFLPLLSITNELKVQLTIKILLNIILIFIPFIFCRMRYSPKHKEIIRLRYKNKKNLGRRLLIV